jgi:hypothetical protein
VQGNTRGPKHLFWELPAPRTLSNNLAEHYFSVIPGRHPPYIMIPCQVITEKECKIPAGAGFLLFKMPCPLPRRNSSG